MNSNNFINLFVQQEGFFVPIQTLSIEFFHFCHFFLYYFTDNSPYLPENILRVLYPINLNDTLPLRQTKSHLKCKTDGNPVTYQAGVSGILHLWTLTGVCCAPVAYICVLLNNPANTCHPSSSLVPNKKKASFWKHTIYIYNEEKTLKLWHE